jgi:nucleotide-binding universal stress UspA family protein
MGGVQYTVAVAVGNPEHVEQLLRTGLDVARDRDGRLVVFSVVTKPRASPTSVLRDEVIRERFSEESQALLDQALEFVEGTDVPVEGRLVVADDVADGVVEGARQAGADAVLMGWHARQRRDIVMGHIVDDVVATAPCDVLVEKIGPPVDGVDRLLLPVGENAHTDLAVEVARAIALANDATVEVFRVVEPDADAEERGAAEALVTGVAADLGGVETDTVVEESTAVVETLVAAAESHDVTVIGGGRGGIVRRFAVGTTARRVGRRADATVIIGTRNPGVRSRFERFIGANPG